MRARHQLPPRVSSFSTHATWNQKFRVALWMLVALLCGLSSPRQADALPLGTFVDSTEVATARPEPREIVDGEYTCSIRREFSDSTLRADGIWSSFTAAYFPSFHETLESWLDHLKSGGWLALTEVDDLFGHEPLAARTRELLNSYIADSLEQSRYDFRMGGKLRSVLEPLGLELLQDICVPDKELSFSGRALPEILAAWRARFDRMHLLQEFCGAEFENVRDDFLNCLELDQHESGAMVHCLIAAKH